MSLLPDITKQNTDIQQDNTEGQQPPSVDDIINWHIEQSINLGTIGWTMNFPTADFFKDFDPAPFAEAATFDGDIDTDILDAALHEFAAEQERLIDRMNVMEANRPLLEATELEVHRRLLQAGKTQQDIDHYIREKTRLGRKIEDLYRLQYPDPPKNYVEAFINYGPAHNRRSAEINLDINGSLANFESSIKITLECFRDMWEPLASVHHEGSSWKFQWKPKDKSGKTEEKWFPLETERDYKDLIRQATSPSKEQYTPVLTQEIRTEPTEVRESKPPVVVIDDEAEGEDYWEEVDILRDGVPEFDMEKIPGWLGKNPRGWEGKTSPQELPKSHKTLDVERSRALNDQKRVENNTAKQARLAEALRHERQPQQNNSSDLQMSPLGSRRARRVARLSGSTTQQSSASISSEKE